MTVTYTEKEEAFYEGLWFFFNNTPVGSRMPDHMDIEFYLDEFPEYATLARMLEYFKYADEGNVVEEYVFRVANNRIKVRLLDMQSSPTGELATMTAARLQELSHGALVP